jgi:hypothetical protein
MRSDEQQREDRRRYIADVEYEVWRNGGDIDRVDRDRVVDSYYDGRSEDCAASAELRRQRPIPSEEWPPEEEPSDG